MNLLPSRENGTKRNPRQNSKSKSTNVRIVRVRNKYEEEKLNSINNWYANSSQKNSIIKKLSMLECHHFHRAIKLYNSR